MNSSKKKVFEGIGWLENDTLNSCFLMKVRICLAHMVHLSTERGRARAGTTHQQHKNNTEEKEKGDHNPIYAGGQSGDLQQKFIEPTTLAIRGSIHQTSCQCTCTSAPSLYYNEGYLEACLGAVAVPDVFLSDDPENISGVRRRQG